MVVGNEGNAALGLGVHFDFPLGLVEVSGVVAFNDQVVEEVVLIRVRLGTKRSLSHMN